MNTALGNVADKLSATSYAADAANAVGDKAPRARGLTLAANTTRESFLGGSTRARVNR